VRVNRTRIFILLVSSALGACTGSHPAHPPDAGASGSDAGPFADAFSADDASSPDAAALDAASLDASAPDLVWGPCSTVGWPDGYPQPTSAVECSLVEVPIDHGTPDGRKRTIHIGRQKSHAFPSGKALFNIAGGPGGGSVWQAGTIPRLMQALLPTFDMVYVDQRGTGGSGYLGCPGGYPNAIMDWTVCGQALTSSAGAADLPHDLTVDAANDIDFVRQRLGYDKIYVRGGSYGTRVALELMRQHSDTLRAVVLDGVFPPDADYFHDGTVRTDRGVARLVQDCTASASCTAVSPHLMDDLTNRRMQLRMTPRPIIAGGQATVEDEPTYVAVLDSALGISELRFQIPRAIHQAMTGDNAQWNQIMSLLFGVGVADAPHFRDLHRGPSLFSRRPMTLAGLDYVAPGLFMLVICTESLPNSDLGALEMLAQHQTWGDDSTVQFGRTCSSLTVPPLSASLRMPVSSNVKTLILNGDLDLNTFPEAGAHAQATLPGATNIVLPYATHSTMQTRCGAQLIENFFLADGDITRTSTACVAAITPPPW
jgi:pimeloyl-ACP methyl ester carboxylesterase